MTSTITVILKNGKEIVLNDVDKNYDVELLLSINNDLSKTLKHGGGFVNIGMVLVNVNEIIAVKLN